MRRTIPVFLFLLLACGPFFYQAPPSLGNYPERIAAKRWPHLFNEIAPLDPKLPDAPALDETCRKLPETLAPLSPEKRLAEIDKRLAENRSGPYTARRANFLHELREFAADPALFDAAKSYVEWRVQHDTALPPPPPEERPWDMEEAEFKSLHQVHEFRLKQRLTFFKEQIAKAAPLMEPYWRVRRGSFLFDTGSHEAAAEDFNSVIEEFPDHPRAEVAELMLARCKIEQSRALRLNPPAEGKADEITALLDDAESTLTEFITAHLEGRFTPDAEGWLGAIAFDRGAYGTAVKHQLARLDRQPTREITRTVLRECDRIFEKLLETRTRETGEPWVDPKELFDAAAVARHPVVARLFVQHCIDPAAHISLPMWWDDSEAGGRSTIDFLKRRILNPNPFVKVALADLGRELLRTDGGTDATTQTLLAWAATEDGEHEQALALLARIPDDRISDEALQAKAIVLQRLGRHAEAVVAFDTLARSFSNSPVSTDLPYRRSLSLYQSHQSGRAILEMLPLVYPKQVPPGEVTDDAEGPPKLHPAEQLLQWLDTLIQFAPLEELEKALAGVTDNTRQRDLLRDAIRTRAIAAHRFDLAERYLADSGPAPAAEEEWPASALSGLRRMAREDWDTKVVPLAKLYGELAASTATEDHGNTHLQIARQWMAHRGELTLPAASLCYYAASEEEKQELFRRRNALELGLSRDEVTRELDHRDEAQHALEHALEAAKSTDPAIAAAALELANQCLFRLAEFSLYQKSRALETDATRLSADLHAQLGKRFPQSAEAKRSLYFTFTPMAGPWMPGDYNPSNAADAMIGALRGRAGHESVDDSETMAKIEALVKPFEAVDAERPLAGVRHDLEAAAKELAALRPLVNPEDPAGVVEVIDRLDDLRAAASLPGIRTADFASYAAGDFSSLPPVFKSLLDFRERVKVLTDSEGEEIGLKDDTINGWSAFLETYPDSPKAEAASFRMTRLIARKYRSGRKITAIHFPEAPIPNGYKHVEIARMDPANDPAEVLAAITRHQERFPMGRYQDDLNLLRAGALIDQGKYSQSLALLGSILANPAQSDLHVMAVIEFADVAQRLLDPEQRAQTAKAIRRTPGAMDNLRRLVDGDTFLNRLKPLMPWLENG